MQNENQWLNYEYLCKHMLCLWMVGRLVIAAAAAAAAAVTANNKYLRSLINYACKVACNLYFFLDFGVCACACAFIFTISFSIQSLRQMGRERQKTQISSYSTVSILYDHSMKRQERKKNLLLLLLWSYHLKCQLSARWVMQPRSYT